MFLAIKSALLNCPLSRIVQLTQVLLNFDQNKYSLSVHYYTSKIRKNFNQFILFPPEVSVIVKLFLTSKGWRTGLYLTQIPFFTGVILSLMSIWVSPIRYG